MTHWFVDIVLSSSFELSGVVDAAKSNSVLAMTLTGKNLAMSTKLQSFHLALPIMAQKVSIFLFLCSVNMTRKMKHIRT
jgi:hypothetical protein